MNWDIIQKIALCVVDFLKKNRYFVCPVSANLHWRREGYGLFYR